MTSTKDTQSASMIPPNDPTPLSKGGGGGIIIGHSTGSSPGGIGWGGMGWGWSGRRTPHAPALASSLARKRSSFMGVLGLQPKVPC